ncbi:DNA replication and repair protein RecO [Mariprofundus ferrinatatus]|uniref:DNA repair protein RecO n=1 Tax=Mariprofundus ferrinatatus TaxID=1921087 RepID=A0A2K8L4I7_9PROT|nr:DNA repair protein RecO [Mariprofundus ferrinatatus]ATX82240.1 DNA replication and repair protein RecO [Mariprofundus ferrinatatus]
MSEATDQALLVRRIPYGDTSLICHFFTEKHGRIALMARGARRPKSSFRATLEPLYELQISWHPGRSGMGTLTDVNRGRALLNPAQVLDGQELVAIASRLFQEGDLHGFNELNSGFEVLSSCSQQPLPAAVWKLLEQTGWLGDMSHCWLCSVHVEGSMYWSEGHLLCSACGKGMEISAGLRKSIAALMHGERVLLSEQNAVRWREMIRLILQQHGVKATDSFKC